MSSGQVSSESQLGLGGARLDGPLGGSIGGGTKIDGGWKLCVIALAQKIYFRKDKWSLTDPTSIL